MPGQAALSGALAIEEDRSLISDTRCMIWGGLNANGGAFSEHDQEQMRKLKVDFTTVS